MTNPPTSLILKILRVAGIALLAGLVLLALSMVAGKAWLEHRFLRQEIHLPGKGSLHIYGGELGWTLRFRCDSAWYRSPALRARLGKTEAHLWFPLPLSAQVKLDTVFIRLIANTTIDSSSGTGKKSAPPPAFPVFKIPILAALEVRSLSVEDDSGVMVSAWDMKVRNPNMEKIRADIGMVVSPRIKNLRCSVSTFLDWSARDSVDLEATVFRDKDQVHLKSRHARSNLLRARGSLLAQAADSRIYTKALGVDTKNLPFARETRLEVQATQGDSLEAHVLLQSQAQGFPQSLPLALSPQRIDARLDGRNQNGQWKINSKGKTREDVSLQGALRRIPFAADDSLTPIWRRFAVLAHGYARNFRIHVGKKIVLAEVRVKEAQWDGKNLSTQLSTGDSSQVKAQAHQEHGNWSGKFSVRIMPHERWVLAFVDTNVSFAALEANGTVQGKTVTASLTARNISGYGVHLDSLFSEHVYGPHGYALTSSRLVAGEDAWSLSGTVQPAKPVPILNFRLESPTHGSIEFLEGRDQTMHVTARHFEIAALPYAGLAKLPVQKPVLDGIFEWNMRQHAGATEVQIAAEFKNEKVGVHAKAHWDAQYLEIENVLVNIEGSSLDAYGRLHLKGRQFYEVAKLRLPDYESVGLETNHFDLAHALSLLQPRPFLKSGEMQGHFAYADAGGFKGSLVFTHIVPTAQIGDAVLKHLQLDGTGDTLVVLGVTASETTPLLRDSLRIAVTHVLESSQQIRVDAVAADSLHLRMDAVSTHLQSLQGRLQVQGRAPLPENSGLLDQLRVDVDFAIPFQDVLGKATLTTRAFQGDYTIPPATRQHFSLDPALLNGILQIPHLSLKDDTGRTLQGDARYVIKSRALRANVSGDAFAMQWTENRKVALTDLKLACVMDSTGMRITGNFSKGSVLYADPPLRAEGDLKTVTFSFIEPPASVSHAVREPPSLQFSGSLSQSLIRYRIKSLSAVQDFFKKEGNKKRGGGGRIHPMRIDARLHTVGDANRIDSDILRLAWVGDLEMQGIYPFTLVRGRINSLNGELGFHGQAYQIRQLEVKWLNAPLEEGEAQLEARKSLARTCDRSSGNPAPQDSCVVINRLQGPLSQLQFSYDTDCGGAYGAGASVAALLYSVQRGCYDASLSNGGSGAYGGKALSLLEPTVNSGLSGFVGRHSYSWIEQTEISGLSSLAGRDSTGDSLSQALSLQVTSKEFLHFRLKFRSGYHLESQDLSNPWENMMALEWWPPLQKYVEDPDWKRRLDRHVNVAASVRTLPVQRNISTNDEVEKMLGLNYAYDFWGFGWGKPAKTAPKKDTASAHREKLP